MIGLENYYDYCSGVSGAIISINKVISLTNQGFYFLIESTDVIQENVWVE